MNQVCINLKMKFGYKDATHYKPNVCLIDICMNKVLSLFFCLVVTRAVFEQRLKYKITSPNRTIYTYMDA